jgi:MOSC domain-containing protein YiiM
MKLVAVSVALPKAVEHENRSVQTGIFKAPVPGRRWLRRTQLDGDGQADLTVHGGADKAAYAYPIEHYPVWEKELGRTGLPPGQFGENFTVEGLTEANVHIGDRFRIGTAEVEVTQPRKPCFKLGIRMGDPAFIKRFLASERSGFYLRVVQEGQVAPGDVIERSHSDPAALSIRAAHRLMFSAGPKDSGWRDAVERAIGMSGLSQEWKETFQERLLERV